MSAPKILLINPSIRDLELFVKTLNDPTEPVDSTSNNFTMEEMLRYRSHMARADKGAIDSLENVWRERRGLPPRCGDEQLAEQESFRADVQKLADKAWAKHLEKAEVAELAYRPETAHSQETGM
jgi:hypothetical protein